jgi:glyoxylase I family protein
MQIPVTGYAHVRITVNDIDRSRAFYDEVFGFPVAHELPPDADAETRERLWFLFGGVIYQLPTGLFGLRPVGPGGDFFDEDRVGLDHVSFAVTARSDLETVVSALDARGVAHGGVTDIGGGWILEFRDPDGIALELFAPNA